MSTNLNKKQPVDAVELQEVTTPVEETAAETIAAVAGGPAALEIAEEHSSEAEVETPVKKMKAKDRKPVLPNIDFDWSAYEKGDSYGEVSKETLIETYSQSLSKINDNEVIMGRVTSLNKREVVINIGYKSDGVISTSEFRYNPDLKVGDDVEVYIESQEDKKGQLILSHKKARASRAWDKVNAALESGEIVTGYVKCRTKGGMIVDIFDIEAFLPGSQIDVKPIRDYDIYIDKTMEFKIVKINHDFKNVVVSHKAIIEKELEQQKQEIISRLEKGQVLEGIVKNITSYGVFVDLGGVDGLIHITDLSWGRINHPDEVVKLEDKVNVVILDFDDEKRRISLGLKQLTPHPWEAFSETLQAGDKVKGKVVVVTDYGVFIEIHQGVEGLVHVSEMSWTQHLRSAQDFVKIGDEVEAIILSIDREDRKISLGIKQMKDDPWETIEANYAIGSKHTAKVHNLTNYGVFVEIEEGVEGLIHISDLSWTKKIKHPGEFTSVGSEIEVQVLEIDKGNRRLSLGHKQVEENPWDVFETLFTLGSIHEGTVIELLEKGSVISLPYGVEGFATPRHLVKADGSQVQLDEKLPFKIIEFNKDSKRIIVSHSRIQEDEQRAEAGIETGTDETSDIEKKPVKRTRKKKEEPHVQPALEKTTLGDISELAELKEQMDEKKGRGRKKKEPEQKPEREQEHEQEHEQE